jgi:hypothetical protein
MGLSTHPAQRNMSQTASTWKSTVMGLLDFLFSKQQKQRKAAIAIGLESGLFVMCPICHDVTEAPDPSLHRPATEALVKELVRQGDPRTALFDNRQTDIIQTLAQVARDLPYQCNCHSI